MTIAFIVPCLESGGAEHVMRLLASALNKRKDDDKIILVSILDNTSSKEQGHWDDVEIVRLGCKRVSSSLLRLRSVFLTYRVDVALSTLPHVIRIVSILKIVLGGRFFHIARLANTYSQQLKDARRKFREPAWVTRAINRSVDRFIAVSEGVKKDYVNLFGVSPQKIVVINNPVDPSILKRSWSPEGHSGNPKRILMVGRLVRQKNVGLALRAFKCLKEVFDGDVRLTLLGDGQEKAALNKLAEELGIADHIDVEGFHRDTAAYYSSSNVFLLTSLYEGFPNVLLEALAHGLPVVSVDCPSGPSDILVRPELGALTRYDERQIALALKQWLSEYPSEKREARRKFVQETFSIERIAKLYDVEIQQALGNRRQRRPDDEQGVGGR